MEDLDVILARICHELRSRATKLRAEYGRYNRGETKEAGTAAGFEIAANTIEEAFPHLERLQEARDPFRYLQRLSDLTARVEALEQEQRDRETTEMERSERG